MIKFNDFDTECYFLACCLQGPLYWKNVPESYFHEDISKKAYIEYKKFLLPPYSTYPTFDLVIEKCPDIDVKLFTQELKHINIDTTKLNTKLYDLYEMYASRKVLDIIERVPGDMEKMRVEEVVRARIKD